MVFSSEYLVLPAVGSPSWKSPVANLAALPATGNTIGDARVTDDTSSIYIWNGTSWVVVGGGGGGGVTSLGNVGGTPNARGGTISGTVLTLAPASLTQPGSIVVGAQTIAMPKSFEDSSTLSTFTFQNLFNASVSQNQPMIIGLDQNGNHNTALDTHVWIYGNSNAQGVPILNLYDAGNSYLNFISIDGNGGFIFNSQGGLSTFNGQITTDSIYNTSTQWFISSNGAGQFGSSYTWDSSGDVVLQNVTVGSNATTTGGQWILRSTGDGYASSGSFSWDMSGNVNMNVLTAAGIGVGGMSAPPSGIAAAGSLNTDGGNFHTDGSGNVQAASIVLGNGATGTFTTADPFTVTVTNGIITSIV